MRKRSWRNRVLGAAVTAVAGALIATPVARAANENTPMMAYLGYYALFQQYGASLADGSNVSVAIDESASGSAYYPNPADGRFANKTMTATSSFTLANGSSSHATTVGARFFGNDTGFSQRSVAPKLGNTATGQSVQMYSYSEFTGLFFLSPGSGGNPEPYGSQNNARVASHAYNYSDYTTNFITRFDYIQQRDDYLQVVGNNNFGSMGDTFNSIVVVSSDGTTTKTDAIGTGTPYTAGRVSPTITGPVNGSPSDAIGQTAGVVGLLMSIGKTTHSNYSYTTATTTAVAPYTGSFSTYTKPGYIVHSGDTAEVVKAALMAGALRSAPANATLSINGISDYRVAAANQTANGLDYRWGAGMVNAQNSYYIINAGETDGAAGSGTWGGGIGQYGFDYNAHFGGANGTKKIAEYGFVAGASPGKFMASLVWNIKIAGASTPGGAFDSTATLYNLSLTLTDLTTSTVVANSASLADNTQNIWVDLVAGDKYKLTVNGLGSAFDWDFGLAWRSEGAITATAVPEPGTLSLIGVTAAAGLLRRRRAAK